MVNIFTPSGSSCLRFARLPYFAPAVLLFLSGCAPANKRGYFPQQAFATTVNDTLADALDFYLGLGTEDGPAVIRSVGCRGTQYCFVPYPSTGYLFAMAASPV